MSPKLFTKAWRREIKSELNHIGYVEGYWTPELTTVGSGTDIFFETAVTANMVLSNNNHTATITDPGTEGISGGYFTNLIFDTPIVQKTGWPVLLPEDPSTKPNASISLYLMFTSGTSFPPSVGLTAVVGVVDGQYNLFALGNAMNEDWNGEVNINLSWSATTQYTVAYDPTVGSYGAMYFYVDNTLIYSYQLTAAIVGTIDRFATYGGVSADSWSVTIQNTPEVSIPGVNFVGGSSVSVISNYPVDRAGKAYQITGLPVEGLEIPDFGFVYNDDIVFFDLNGMITVSQ